jgi:hypothetical protein
MEAKQIEGLMLLIVHVEFQFNSSVTRMNRAAQVSARLMSFHFIKHQVLLLQIRLMMNLGSMMPNGAPKKEENIKSNCWLAALLRNVTIIVVENLLPTQFLTELPAKNLPQEVWVLRNGTLNGSNNNIIRQKKAIEGMS